MIGKVLKKTLWCIGKLLVAIGSHWNSMPTNPLLVILYTGRYDIYLWHV